MGNRKLSGAGALGNRKLRESLPGDCRLGHAGKPLRETLEGDLGRETLLGPTYGVKPWGAGALGNRKLSGAGALANRKLREFLPGDCRRAEARSLG